LILSVDNHKRWANPSFHIVYLFYILYCSCIKLSHTLSSHHHKHFTMTAPSAPVPQRPRDGTAVGAIRAAVDLAKLLPYLEQNVVGFQGPLDIKQFGVSMSSERASRSHQPANHS
jgi:hypothetical protein